MVMSKQRMEALSDGIVAIIITLMAFGIPLPEVLNFGGVMQLVQSIFIYFVSFVVVASFWSRHHHLFGYISEVSGNLVLTNFMFLFFLSLIPIFTKWVMLNPGNLIPALCYDATYLVVYITYILIFHYVIEKSEADEIKAITGRFEKGHNAKKNKSEPHWRRIILFWILVASVVVVSILVPQVSTFIMLGLPVLASVTSLVFDESRHGRFNEITESDN